MTNIEEQYNKQAVKISSNGISGSGSIYQPSNPEYSYILTAKHCITEDGNFEIDKIQINRFLDDKSEEQLTIKNVYIHDEHDIAVLVVEKIKDVTTTSICRPSKDESVSIYGYPNFLNKKPETRQIIKCKISFARDLYYEITSEATLFTFEKSIPQTIIGLSGSGVYFEREGILSISGIFTKLKASDGAYNSFCMFSLDLFEKFIQEKQLQSLFSDDISNINKDPELMNKVFALTYNARSAQYYLIRPVDEILLNYLKNSKNIWISGDSGVGKTFLVLGNITKVNESPIHIDLTCSKLTNIDDYFEYINNELIAQTNLKKLSDKPSVYDKISDNLCEINSLSSQITIFVDEVPILAKDKFYEFLHGFIKIAERFTNIIKGAKKVNWIISTRIDPQNHLKDDTECLIDKQKGNKNFIFKNLNTWSNDELLNLLKMLQVSLNFTLSSETEIKIIEASKGLPGILKNVIERIILENCSIEDAIQLIKSENI